MIKEFVRYWEVGKENLRDYFKKTKQEKYSEYKDLVVALFKYVINPGIQCDSAHTRCYDAYDTKKITVIDDGDYQGTLLFVLPRRSYQPFVDDYVYTSVCYGSCSGCDTLLGISHYSDVLPNKNQIDDYMTLCLHLLQNCRFMECEDLF